MDKHKAAHKLLLENFDTNGDGKIDAAEYKVMLERFAEIDLNEDGMISEFEVREYMAANPDQDEKFIRSLIEIDRAQDVSLDSRRNIANFAHKYGNSSHAQVATTDRLQPIITPLEEYFDDIADIFRHIEPVQASEDDYIDDYARYSLWIMLLALFFSVLPILLPVWTISCCIRPVNDGLVGLMGGVMSMFLGPWIFWLSGDSIIRVKKRLTPFYEVDVVKSCCCVRPIDIWTRAWELYGIVYPFQPFGDAISSDFLANTMPCCCTFMKASERQLSFTSLDGPIQGKPLPDGADHPVHLHGNSHPKRDPTDKAKRDTMRKNAEKAKKDKAALTSGTAGASNTTFSESMRAAQTKPKQIKEETKVSEPDDEGLEI